LDPLEAAFLGIVQGLTEFFPVSSSGHLAMFQYLLGDGEQQNLVFEIAVHVATLVAIAYFYRNRIRDLVVGFLRGEREARIYGAKLALASVPAAIVGVGFQDEITALFSNPLLIGVALCVTGCIVYSARFTAPRATDLSPGWLPALWIGCAQAVAILPGISRSGSTVAMALAIGLVPAAAAEFSFRLGIIAVGGAAILMLPEIRYSDPASLMAVGIGSLTALVSGLAAITFFVRMLDRRLFHAWAWYCWAVGAFFLAWQLA
jgi:undecaprenyl-diphosphatase